MVKVVLKRKPCPQKRKENNVVLQSLLTDLRLKNVSAELCARNHKLNPQHNV